VQLNEIVAAPSLLQAMADERVFDFSKTENLPYSTGDIRFLFRPAFINHLAQSRIFYKLEGLGNEYMALSDSLGLRFNKLRAGYYRLVAKTINADGFESPETVLCSFTIKKPYWQQTWFIISALLGSILVTIKITGNVQRKKRLQLEKENRLTEQLLKERERISKELHDNLGASLVTIVAQADNIETQLMNNKTTEALLKTQQLGNQSRETVNILRETIWAVQESEHTLNDFVLRVKNYLQRTLPASNIEWQVTVNGTLDKPLSPVQTLHLFRIIQEATQNIIKHSGATKAGYLFDALNKTLVVTITDNGRGFNSSEQFYTNGLKNMHTRAEEINGRAMVASGPDGTRISVFIET
ncbi:MAG: hypothetical protein JNM68_01830, partial [Dinghuibacter sp.]|nr:hypothetical protein [Dinghuibacter sp.]